MTNRVEIYEKTFAGHESFIAQHRSAGTGLLPASVQIEMAMVGVSQRRPFAPLELTDVAFLRPLVVADDGAAAVRLSVTFGAQTRFELSTVVGGERKPLSTGSGRLLTNSAPAQPDWLVSGSRPVTSADLYESWSRAGLQYGPDFRTVQELSVGDGVAHAVLRTDAEPMRWYAHPLLVDGVFQVVSCALQDVGGAAGPRPMLPIGVARILLLADLSRLTAGVSVRVRRTSVEGAYSVADALVVGPSGELVAEFQGIRMRSMPASGAQASRSTPQLVTRLGWRATPGSGSREPATGTWVILHSGGSDSLGERTARQLRAEGARVVEVSADASVTPAGDRRVMASPDEAAFRQLWDDIADPVDGVVHLWNSGVVQPEESELQVGLYGCLAALKTLGERQRRSRFFVATEAAQPLADDDTPIPARAALWGLIRTAAIEYPGLHPRLIDLDGASGDALPAELGDGPVETGYRSGDRFEPVRLRDRQGPLQQPPIRRAGRYLILGGHGGLGLEVATRLAEEGAGLVALVSRSGGSGADQERLAGIRARGCSVASYSVDVTVPGELAAAVEEIGREYGDLHGVVHAAGTLKDGLIRTATVDDIAAVMGPKVGGVHELAAAVAGLDLDFAVLFASVSGTFGNLGQGGYAAANAYLDAFAHARKKPWLSVDWGLWAEVGMGTAVAEQLRRRGVRPLGTAEALDALMSVLQNDARQLVIAHPDASDTIDETDGPLTVPETAEGVAEDARPHGSATSASAERVEEELERFLAQQLGVTGLDRGTPLTDYGMSSIMSVELSEELSRRWGIQLPATLFLEYGDFAELVRALIERYGAATAVASSAPAGPAAGEPRKAVPAEASRDAEPASPSTSRDATNPTPRQPVAALSGRPRRGGVRSEDIAVVAVSGDLPGATNLADFWAMLRGGGDAFTDVPAERWDVDAHFEKRGPHMTGTYCRRGSFLTDIDRFDPKFFGISIREAEDMDSQQKLLLEHAWSVIDDSGLAGRHDIGVFVGATYTHHRDAQGLETVGPHTALGSMNAVLANRISYALDLTGPSQTVDTLCSSSLVAVQQAMTSLRAGHCGAAVVAACHVGLTPWYYRSLSQLGALSETRPRPFDDRADGFVPGEGAVAVLLKRLEDAERDGDRIWGVVRGAAVNHGGRGSALSVPRSESQVAVIRAALADAEVTPADISVIETHGTATRLGDPIEIAALTEVFGEDTPRSAPCFIGSVKANIGHLEPASGLAGLVKILLCLQHGEIPPLAGFETPGSHIDFSAGPFVIPTEQQPWRPDGPRRAGISSFGMGGTNAHIVVEEYVADSPAGPAVPPALLGEHLLVLSAHTPERLVQRAADVRQLLERDESLHLGALCYSAAAGRDHLPYRVAVAGSTAAELRAGLRTLQAQEEMQGTVVRGATVLKSGLLPVDAGVAESLAPYTSLSAERIAAQLRVRDNRPVTALAFLYATGAVIDWHQVYDGVVPRRITLPPYPFRARPTSGPQRPAEDADPDPAEVSRRVTKAHRVFGQETVPAALIVALGFQQATVLERIAFTGRGTGPHPLTTDLDGPSHTGPVTFRHGDRAIAHLRTGTSAELGEAPGRLEIEALRAGLERRLDPAGLYAWFAAKDMDFAAPLRTITEIHYGSAGVLARVSGAGENPLECAVAAIDAALQSMAVLTLADPAAPSATYLPVSIGRAVMWDNAAQTGFVLLRASEPGPDGIRRGDATLLSADGRVLVALEEVEYRPVTSAAVTNAVETPPAKAPGPVLRSRETAAAEGAVVELVRRVFRDPSITPTTALSAVGLDSMLATRVAAEIEEACGAKLSPTDVLDVRDCRTLASLVAELAPDEAFSPVGESAVSQAPAVTSVLSADATMPASDAQDMAVIGFAHALPGARDEAQLWSMLSQGGTGISSAPSFRWSGYADGQEPDVGGFLDSVEEFDARFFEFFPKQAEVLDPQVRWLLRTTWEALESAGLPALSLPSSTGVFVGASYQHYKDYNIAPELDAPSGLGNHNAFLANRVSYFLDLRGPSMTIDTLCSSSLVALHTAVRSIRDGECEQAIVAGVRVAMSPLHYVAMKNLRALSPSGVSRAFDAGADGFVPGEGVVTVVIKPLQAALRDGDRIRGVIKGSAVNHGGRTSGLTVPNSSAQHAVISAALRDAGVDAGSIGMLEAHGTGTGLGDPIEIDGLTRAWREFTDRSQFCAIGSLKSNIGHLEPAAGLAGLVKVLLAMEHERIPPTLHMTRPNDHIRFEDTPFYVADRVVPWPRTEAPRRAGLSAFGMGGANAHVIVEEAPPVAERSVPAQESHVVRVSGASEEAVRELSAVYADRFDESRTDRETADLCHTANVGRSALEFQTAVLGRTAADIAEALRAVADGRVPVTRADLDLTPAEAASSRPEPAAAPDRHAWVVDMVRRGYAHVDWASLSAPLSRLTGLPTYPFARGRYWHTHKAAAPNTETLTSTPESAGAFRVEWRVRELPQASSADPVSVRVVVTERAMGDALSAALRDMGVPVVESGQEADAIIVVAADDQVGGDSPGLSDFWADLRTLMTSLPPQGRLLWAVRRSAAVHAYERSRLLPEAAASAMAVRAACAENRKTSAVLDLDPADPAEVQARQIAVEYAALRPGADAVAAYRRGVRYAPEPVAAPPSPSLELSTEGYYLVTGGLGAVGRRLAGHLIDRGAKRIGIVGRSVIDDAASVPLRDMARRAEVEYLSCDVSDGTALTTAAARFGTRWGPLLGVVHSSGGVNPFGAMHRRHWDDAAKVIAPKVAGSLNVVRLAKAERAHFAVLVSSIAGAQPQAGRGLVDYSLANAYQLALAERESDTVTTITAHAWPNWTGIGMEADASFSAAQSITLDEALEGFAAHLGSGGGVIFPGRAPQGAQASLSEPVPVPASTPAHSAAERGAMPAPTPNARAGAAMRARVRDAFLHVLGEDPGDRLLQGLGLDSLAIAELTTALEQRSGLTVDPSVLMRARTADDIAAQLAVTGAEEPSDAGAPASAADGEPEPTLSDLLRSLLPQNPGR
ncbi:SDR family NAD(P)-dependent oxidoreductase [Streptomyces lunaelactis]|uniref:SDR family NAD(P)-dependent oxidoreductase n=1 Tax=Streptomyces lunaelactis TaxID=1535768 RepID=UPI001584EE86|nr:SDR family NAD(P)-dependent oxidoreductase [Streptomyces lunaelactis]NUK22500.1 SDR family NAD(P)-dependent oxidoreductase [Streptomyces lunaelactis]NUK49989.1 SDR family NAD(P)-dependent oxidoreductase [Streptomyces lunaelactis]NUK64249.1 SDR family NAD(P)-dependent oxidoreductase [Streptomyces lunaelactis]